MKNLSDITFNFIGVVLFMLFITWMSNDRLDQLVAFAFVILFELKCIGDKLGRLNNVT